MATHCQVRTFAASQLSSCLNEKRIAQKGALPLSGQNGHDGAVSGEMSAFADKNRLLGF